MAKADDLMRTAGSVLAQSSSIRPGPVGMTSVAAASGLKDPRKEGLDRSKTAFSIPLAKIKPDPSQPRTGENRGFDDEEISRLAASLVEHGQISPISVAWSIEDGCYRVISGERRYRAAIRAGWTSIECKVEEKVLDEGEILVRQIVENLLREGLEPMEQARGFHTLLTVNGWPVTRIAKELGLSHSAVSQSLRLVSLPESIQGQIESGVLTPVAGYHIAKLDDPGAQAEVVERILAENLNREETVEVVRQAKAGKPSASKGRGGKAKGKPRKVTERVIRTEGGSRVTVENRKGLDVAAMLAALGEAMERLRAELGDDQVAA
jgi:ParB family transcriptional regulator, chromosome partitioning protein